MAKKYIYNGTEYASEYQVRQAIWKNEHKIFGSPETAEDWVVLGVTATETIDPPSPTPREPDLDELKQMKLGALDGAFEEYRQSSKTFLISSLGFKANANVTAFDNVSGLVAQLQYANDLGYYDKKIGFMDFNDQLHEIGLTELKTLQVEISANGSNCYAQKWALRNQIQNVQNEQELEAIEIKFEPTDFTAEA